jgi:hypothetical protein
MHVFLKCTSDPNVYIKQSHNSILLLGLYIDDMVIIFNNFCNLTITKAIFNQLFSMTGNKEIGYILGIQIQQDRFHKTLLLSQEKYIHDVLTKFTMATSHLVATPLEASI